MKHFSQSHMEAKDSNCIIFVSETSKRLAAAKRMEELCDNEMYAIEICGECFLRFNQHEFENNSKDNNWFTEVCHPPHLLVWAKSIGHLYWPAKVVAQTTNKVDVRFFGQHKPSFVYPSDCFLFSIKNPNRSLDPSTEEEMRTSLKVCKL